MSYKHIKSNFYGDKELDKKIASQNPKNTVACKCRFECDAVS